MHYEKISIMPDRSHVYLEYYGNDDRTAPAAAMLVIPGGGYSVVCHDREGGSIALAYLARGMNAFVLHYSVGSQIKSPTDPLYEASLAMLHIRKNAQKYNINPERVFAVGFSAGGHLAGSLGVLWNDSELQARLGCCGPANRPQGVLLCYPVITAFEHAHSGSFKCLLQSETPAHEQLERFSLEKNVTADSSPAFLMHTFDDATVPVENSLLMAQAYSAAHVPCEVHIFPHGPHGVALGNTVTWGGCRDWIDEAIAGWVDSSMFWMVRVK